MTLPSNEISVWLYTSQFRTALAAEEVGELALQFATMNLRFGITGYMISDGSIVMQYVEGEAAAVQQLRQNIQADPRHHNVRTQIAASVKQRAYPDWSMKALQPQDYEELFGQIDKAASDNLAVQTSKMIFDATFMQP